VSARYLPVLVPLRISHLARYPFTLGVGILLMLTTRTGYPPSKCVTGKEYSMPRRFQGLGEYVTVLAHFNSNSAKWTLDSKWVDEHFNGRSGGASV
jgi:hypothetical protein